MTATLSLPQETSSVARARQLLDSLLGAIDIVDDDRDRLALLITEACANAIRHADRGTPVDVTVTVEDRDCIIEVGNCASHFSPGEIVVDLPDPLATAGRGLPLIAALADDVRFVPSPPGRVLLRIVKKLT